jgi:hypothetical protein
MSQSLPLEQVIAEIATEEPKTAAEFHYSLQAALDTRDNERIKEELEFIQNYHKLVKQGAKE